MYESPEMSLQFTVVHYGCQSYLPYNMLDYIAFAPQVILCGFQFYDKCYSSFSEITILVHSYGRIKLLCNLGTLMYLEKGCSRIFGPEKQGFIVKDNHVLPFEPLNCLLSS